MYIYIYIYIKTGKEMKLNLGTQSFMQNTKHLYIIQPIQLNYIQCSNVKNYDVKISLFLCDFRVLDHRRKSS